MQELKIEYIPIADIKKYKGNAKSHPAEQIEQIAKSIEQFGFNDPIAIDENNTIIEGHGRLLAVNKLIKDGRSWANRQYDDAEKTLVPVIRLDYLDEQAKKAYILAHNKLTMNSGFDLEILTRELEDITDFDMGDFGFIEKTESEEQAEAEEEARNTLSEIFTIPPFSVLDCRSGEWQRRKQAWKTLIKDDGSARSEVRGLGHMSEYVAAHKNKKLGATFENSLKNGASLLDPVLSELVVQWFTPLQENGINVFDTFAGDTVFGFVSAYMGKNFTGIELRPEQATFNQNRLNDSGLTGRYINDDGRNVGKYLAPESQDLFFSCPPYYDMEVYSNRDNDASNQPTYEAFYAILDEAFTEASRCLKQNRFAVVTAQNIRNKTDGGYYNFTGDIKNTFARNGFVLYNELVLVRTAGLGAMFVAGQMKNRKVRKTHEDVLVFYKGDPEKIKETYGTDFSDFMETRQSVLDDQKVMVFYKGDTASIKEEFGRMAPVMRLDDYDSEDE